jgi:hypothetical protein
VHDRVKNFNMQYCYTTQMGLYSGTEYTLNTNKFLHNSGAQEKKCDILSHTVRSKQYGTAEYNTTKV